MSLINWQLFVRLLSKELTVYKRLNGFFILNLGLGLIGLTIINALQYSVNDYLASNLRNSLGADIVIHSNQPINEAEWDVINNSSLGEAQRSDKIEFFSMIRGQKRTRLVNLVAVDEKFPLYGNLAFVDNTPITQMLRKHATSSEQSSSAMPISTLWMFPETRKLFNLSIGDQVKVGSSEFLIGQDLDPDTAGLMGFSLAPKVFLHKRYLTATKLIQMGSRIHYSSQFQLADSQQTTAISQEIKKRLYQDKSLDTTLRVRTYHNANNQITGILQPASGYLSMVAMVALFLSIVATAYLFHSLVIRRYQDMAILRSLGVTSMEIQLLYAGFILALGMVATLFALLVSQLILPLFGAILASLNLSINPIITVKSVLITAGVGLFGSLVAGFPALLAISRVQPLQLLSSEADINPANQQSKLASQSLGWLIRLWHKLKPYLPIIGFIYIMSVIQSGLFEGTVFLLLFSGALLILTTLGWLAVNSCIRLSNKVNNITLKIALRNLGRHKLSTISSIVALGLGAFLMNLVPQIYQGIQSEIDSSEQIKLPSMFLVDIQPEQVQPLQQLLQSYDQNKDQDKEQNKDQDKDNKRQLLNSLSPMIMARLKTVDGEAPKKRWREQLATNEPQNRQQQQENQLDRGVRLTYRNILGDYEQVIKGQWFSSTFTGSAAQDDPIPLSVEKRYADRLQATIGSVFEFDIQGIPVFAKVTNIRQVQWNSFRPNFFLVMPPGLLEDAPKSYLATLTGMENQQRAELQDRIVDKFANISVIDIAGLVTKVLGLTEKIALSISLIALFSILAGLVVIYSIAKVASGEKASEINLYKVLGGTRGKIYSLFIIEFGFIAFFSALLGILLSLIASWLLSGLLFDNLWEIQWLTLFITLIGISSIAIAITLLSSKRLIQQKPWRLLRAT